MSRASLSRRGTWCRALCLAWLTILLLGSSAPGQTAGDSDAAPPALTRAEAALADGLYRLAGEQARDCLAVEDIAPDSRLRAVLVLVQALYHQDRYRELLEVLASRGDSLSEGARRFWSAAAEYGLGMPGKALERLSREGPEDDEYAARAVRLQAWCHLAQGDTNRALSVYGELHAEFPDDPDDAQNLLEWGLLLFKVGPAEEAERVLSLLAGKEEASAPVLEGRYWLGRARMEQRRWQEAEAVLAPLADNKELAPHARCRAALALSEALAESGRREEAVGRLRRVEEDAVDAEQRTEAQRRLGHQLVEMGNLEEGIPILKSYVASSVSDPQAGITQLFVAQALLDRRRYEEAVAEFQHHLETFTNRLEQALAYSGKGQGLLKLDRSAEAAVAFEKAAGLFADSEDIRQSLFKMGDALFAAGQYQAAADAYRRVVSEFPDSPLVPHARFQMAESLVKAGDGEAGLDAFAAVHDESPENPYAELALLRMAAVLAEQGQWLQALQGFNRVMGSYPGGATFAEALFRRGVVYYRLFRFEEALADFDRVVNEFPDSDVVERAYTMRGMCYYWTGRDEKAKELARDFIRRYPDSPQAPEVLYWIGVVEYNQANYRAAETNFIEFVDRYPADDLTDDALLRAGLCASKQKEYHRAIEFLSRLAKEFPQSEKMAHARFAQADALAELARFSEAILIFDDIINRHPHSELLPMAWMRKGDCQFTLGAEDPKRYQESIESYRVVANSSQADLDLVMQALYKIGRCREKMGQVDEAFEQYYFKVIIRYLEDREKGIWHNEASKIWFTRAAVNAADIMEARQDWRTVVRILERVIKAGVPAADEARERIERIKSEHWWLF